MSRLSQERLKELFFYNSDSGEFVRLINCGAEKAGAVAGCQNRQGYTAIQVDGTAYYAHRLAFLYVSGCWPEGNIDHINHNPSDNRWCNLREVTQLENARNAKKSKRNSSGFNGVCWYKPLKKWNSYIRREGKQVNLGYFDSLIDAIAARIRANKENDYHEFHGNSHL